MTKPDILTLARQTAENIVESLIFNGFIILPTKTDEKLGAREASTQLTMPHIAHAINQAIRESTTE